MAYEKSIIRNNILYENLKYGIMIESLKKSYIISNYLFLNNYGLACKNSIGILTKNNILYCNMLAISFFYSSYVNITNNIFFNNNIGLNIAGNSFNIYINRCLYSNSPVYILHESIVYINSSLFIICYVGIIASEQTKIFVDKSNFFDNKINFKIGRASCRERV